MKEDSFELMQSWVRVWKNTFFQPSAFKWPVSPPTQSIRFTDMTVNKLCVCVRRGREREELF